MGQASDDRKRIERLLWAACDARDQEYAALWRGKRESNERTIDLRGWSEYLERLLWRSDDTRMIEEIVDAFGEGICDDPKHPKFGAFKSYFEDEDYGPRTGLDAGFILLPIMRLYREFGSQLGAARCATLRRVIELSFVAVIRDYCLGQSVIGYNGRYLEMACLIVGGEISGSLIAVQTGLRRLSDYIDYTAYFGTVWEYNSPTYLAIDLHGLCTIEKYAEDNEARFMARLAKERILLDFANHYHHGLRQMGGPYFRSYFSDIVGNPGSMAVWISRLLDEDIFATTEESGEERIEILSGHDLSGLLGPIFCGFESPEWMKELLRYVPEPGEEPLAARTVVHRGLQKHPADGSDPSYAGLMHIRDLPGEIIMYSIDYAPVAAITDVRDITCVRTDKLALGTSSLIAPHHTGTLHSPLHEKPFLLYYTPDENDRAKSMHIVHRRGLPEDRSVVNYHREHGGPKGGDKDGAVRGGILQDGLSALAGVRIVDQSSNTAEWLAGWAYWTGAERIWIDGALCDTSEFTWEAGQWLVVEDGDLLIALSFVSCTPGARAFAQMVPWHVHGAIDYGIESVFECGIRVIGSDPGVTLDAGLAFCTTSKREYPEVNDLFSALNHMAPEIVERNKAELMLRSKGKDGLDRELTITFGPLEPPAFAAPRVKVARRKGGQVEAPQRMVESPFVVSGKRPLALGDSEVSGGATPVTLSRSPNGRIWRLHQPLSYSVPVAWKVPEGTIRCASMPRGNLVYDREKNVVYADVMDPAVDILFDGFSPAPQLDHLAVEE